jgi:hypothetical protein
MINTMYKKKPLPTHKRRAVSKFVADEMHNERKKPEDERRSMDQILAIGYSKVRKGEI